MYLNLYRLEMEQADAFTELTTPESSDDENELSLCISLSKVKKLQQQQQSKRGDHLNNNNTSQRLKNTYKCLKSPSLPK